MPKIDPEGNATIQGVDGPDVGEPRSRDDSEELLGRYAYGAVGQRKDWRTADGDAMPAWANLDERTRREWVAAANAVRQAVVEPNAFGEPIEPPNLDADNGAKPTDPNADDITDEDPDPYPLGGTTADVLAWVDRDPGGAADRAGYALGEENMRDSGPRSTLVKDLEKRRGASQPNPL